MSDNSWEHLTTLWPWWCKHTKRPICIQDSPSIKFTYTASVSVPKEMRVVMSANLDTLEGKPDESAPSERQVYNFHQNVPMPSYLLAIACGDLDYRKVGPRSKVCIFFYKIHWCFILPAQPFKREIPHWHQVSANTSTLIDTICKSSAST